MEKKIRRKRKQLPKEQAEFGYKDWIFDHGFYRIRDTKILKLTKLHWYTKFFIAQIVKEHSDCYSTICDKLNCLEHKINLICKKVFHMEFSKVSLLNHLGYSMQHSDPESISRVSPSNLILVDDDPKQQDIKNKETKQNDNPRV